MTGGFDVYIGINQNANANQLQGSVRQLSVMTKFVSSLEEIMSAAT